MLLEAGFAPIPLNGKRPVLDDWPNLIAGSADIEQWAQERPSAANTGYLTRLTPTLDIDILDPDAAEAVEQLVKDRYGDLGAVLVRVGKPPKRAIPFTTTAPFPKIVASLLDPNGSEERIELLADGQQCVADGIHPDTGKPYRWLGGAPGQVRRDELPPIDELEAHELVDDVVDLLIHGHGYRRKLEPAPKLNGAAPVDTGAWGFVGNLIDHDALTAGAMTLLQAGMHDAAAVNFLRTAVMSLHDVDEDRRQRRLDEIPAMVRSARAKLREPASEPEVRELRPSAFTADILAPIPVPPRVWHVEGLVPSNTVTLMGGDGGVGKSTLALQLACATAAGLDWLGLRPRVGRALYVSCEDDRDELHRRLDLIGLHYGLGLDAFSNLKLWSLASEDAVLVLGQSGQPLQDTGRWHEFKGMVDDWRPTLVVIDSLADVYGANENDRALVRGFVRMLIGLATACAGAIILLAHPSLAGLSSGSGLSGSTAWNNSVRSRLYLTLPPAEEGAPAASDLRQLQVKKANYGPAGGDLVVRYQTGAFVLDDPMAGPTNWLDREIAADRVDQLFLNLLARFTVQARAVSHQIGRNYAPSLFAQEPEAKGVTMAGFRMAMTRLFAADKLAVVEEGSASRKRSRLIAV